MNTRTPSVSAWLADLDDWLVEAAERIVWDAREGLRDVSEDVSESQVEKAIEVIQYSQGSLRIFQNWVRYQWAREEDRKSGKLLWSIPTGSDRCTVAQRIVEVVQQIEQKAQAIPQEDRRRALMQATARFLGYFKRALKAHKLFEQIRPVFEEVRS